MAQPDPIDTILATLREQLSDTLTMLNIVVALRRNSSHLLQLLSGMLRELSQEIEASLPTLPEEDQP